MRLPDSAPFPAAPTPCPLPSLQTARGRPLPPGSPCVLRPPHSHPDWVLPSASHTRSFSHLTHTLRLHQPPQQELPALPQPMPQSNSLPMLSAGRLCVKALRMLCLIVVSLSSPSSQKNQQKHQLTPEKAAKHMHTHTYKHVLTYIHTGTHTEAHTYAYRHAYAHTHAHTRIYMCTHVYTRAYTSTLLYRHTRIYIRTHMCTHSYTCTHMFTLMLTDQTFYTR